MMINLNYIHWLVGSGDTLCLAATYSLIYLKSQLCFPDKNKYIELRDMQYVHNQDNFNHVTSGFASTV